MLEITKISPIWMRDKYGLTYKKIHSFQTKKRLRKCVSQIFQTDWSDTFTQFSRTYYFFLIHKIQATLHFHDIFWPRSATFFSLRHMCVLWQYGLWTFQTGGTILPKNQHTQRKSLNFQNWVNGEVSKSAKIWLSKSIFCVKNHMNLSFFFH